MNDFQLYLVVFAPPVLLTIGWLAWRQSRTEKRALTKLQEAKEAGLSEPASLHPIIDPMKCLGCATCISACPEGQILGLVNRRAQLVTPSACIGHGACKEACPTGAISLVFGSERRGVEIPTLSDKFETSVPGLFIAGELGGMGLIKNAIAQGQQAAAYAADYARQFKNTANDYDLVIVGAGPAGLSAALAAQAKGLRYVVLEQDTIGGTVAHYPRGKIVMTAPATLPLVGKFQFREASKEALVSFWQDVVNQNNLSIRTACRVTDIKQDGQRFLVAFDKNGDKQPALGAGAVLLALGRRGTPRKLGVKGEQLSKVVYRLVDAEQYAGRHVLVVGGGDSALEAALALAKQANTTVTLSYRGEAFSRVKSKNREGIAALENAGELMLAMSSQVKEITPTEVVLSGADCEHRLVNDDVIVCAGGILPTPFLKQIGIQVDEKFGTV